MQTEPLTGARKPEQGDGPLGGLQISNAVDDIASFTTPRFATTGDRDAAYAARTAAGHTLSDGTKCMVGKVEYEYASGWQVINQPSVRGTNFTTGGITTLTSNHTLASVTFTVTTLDASVGRRVVCHIRGNFGGADIRVGALLDGAQLDPDYGEVFLAGVVSWYWHGASSPSVGSHTLTTYFRSNTGTSVSAGPVGICVEVK